MKRSEKTERIAAMLEGVYPEVPIPLDHEDPYTLLVAVMLSAQSTDKKVNEVTPTLFAAAKTPAEMAALGRERVLEIIRPIGLSPTKSKNLVGLSAALVERHGGEVPASFEDLEALPGVGHKTASVVMAQAFGVPAFPVDTHIHRLAQRWGLSNGDSVVQTEADLKRLFPKEHWNRLHLQIIFWGREFCTARGCDGRVCSMCTELYPNRRKAVIWRKP